MPKPNAFVLTDELDELTFDFRTPKNPSAAHGVIAEPSTKQLQTFQRKLRRIMGPVMELMAAAPNMTVEERAKLMAQEVDEADAEAKHRESLEAVAELCSDFPSAEDITSLPYRAQQVFVGWIVGVFMDPEASTPATKQ